MSTETVGLLGTGAQDGHLDLRLLSSSGRPKPMVPVNMPDPIRKRFGYGQLWSLRPACSQNRAGSYMPDPTSCIHFSSIFSKKAWNILCKIDPDLIWMAWSGFGQRIWSGSKSVCRNHLARFLAGLNQVLAKRIRSGSKPVCKNHPARFWPMLSTSSGPDANGIRHIYWGGLSPFLTRRMFVRRTYFGQFDEL